jgi:streptogramin lyase
MKPRSFALSFVSLWFAAALAAQASVPETLRPWVKGARHRPIREVQLDGVTFHAIHTGSEHPFLLWPAAGAEVDVAADEKALTGWLARAGEALGHRGFDVRFVQRFERFGLDTHECELHQGGIPLRDHPIHVLFQGGRFLGLTNMMPRNVRAVATPTGKEGPDAVLFVDRRADDCDVVIARLVRSETSTHVTTQVVYEDRVLSTVIDQKAPAAPLAAATFTEYAVPLGSFPDQISVDSRGVVWFSQPNNNYLTSFHPGTATFTQHNTNVAGGGTGPDGMIVDSRDRVLTGLYYAPSKLGILDIPTRTFTAYAAPYSPAALAIPVETSYGTIWVTDHQNNKVSEFDPATNTWVRTLPMPTPACWVVQGYEDTSRETLWFTEYNVHKLGRLPRGGTVTDVNAAATSAPAFLIYDADKVYYSEWNRGRLGVLDVPTQTNVEYTYPVNDPGGPLWKTPSGMIACGTRSTGYIMVFDPRTLATTAHRIPSAGSGLKDGLTCGPDGVVWFTQSGSSNKIARLVLP